MLIFNIRWGGKMLKHIKEITTDSREPNKHWERYEWELKSGARIKMVREITKLEENEEYY